MAETTTVADTGTLICRCCGKSVDLLNDRWHWPNMEHNKVVHYACYARGHGEHCKHPLNREGA